jgi:hypothetical protein
MMNEPGRPVRMMVETTEARHERQIERLLDRLPGRLRSTIRWLRLPSSRWVRLPAGVLLVCGSLLAILPIFGLWMLPLGLMLLAEDVPPLRRARDRTLDWIERRRPHWIGAHTSSTEEEPRR